MTKASKELSMCLIVVRLLMVLEPRGEAKDLVPVAEDVPVAVEEAVALRGHILYM